MISPQRPSTQASTIPMNMQSNQQPQDQSNAPDATQPQGASDPSMGISKEQMIHQQLEQRLNSLPPIQQAFVNHYLTPETAVLMGIVGGVEAYNYFKPLTDPTKMASIVPRSSVPQGGQALQEDQQAMNASTPTSTSAANQAPAEAQSSQAAQPTQSETPSS